MTVTGAGELITYLRNMAKVVPDHARRTMNNGADKIVAEAKLNTPVDTHALEEAIHKEVSKGNRGRLQIDIVVNGFVHGVDVSIYALKVHEAYETEVAPRGPGKGTLAKMAANPGRIIGSKFLERAVEDEAPKMVKMMIQAVTEVLER